MGRDVVKDGMGSEQEGRSCRRVLSRAGARGVGPGQAVSWPTKLERRACESATDFETDG